MSQISLKKYNQEIRQTIQSGAIERAIAHCRHILSYYPMYLPVYRLLGYVCLEKGDYSYATHFYQSVLSADPEDANAWSRLSVLTDDLGELEQATWLMERAFEVEPGSSEIRGLLRQLYSRRDGVDRPRIKLSAGALARLYAKGGFYQHAVDELEKMIQGTSGLAPLHIAYLEVVLAEALWHAEGMSAMADNIARRLLDKLPNCLKANLIAGQIRWAVGMEHEAQKHLQLALAMDPEGYVAYQMFGERSPVPLADVQVPYLEREAQAVFVAQPETGDTQVEDLSWLEQIGEITQAGGTLEPIEDQEPQTMPDWLQAWPSEGEAQAADVVEPKPEERVSEEPSAPAWLRELQTREEKEPAIPTWLRDIQQESADEVEEAVATPDWLSDLRPIDGEAQVGAPSLAPVEEEMESEEAVEEETPDWLMALQPEVEESGLDIVTEEMAVEEGLPDWLTELSAKEPSKVLEPTNDEQSLGKFEEELPDWLAGLAPEAEEELVASVGMPEEIEPEEELERAEIPDWLAELTPEAEEEAQVMPIETMEEAEPTGVGEIPDWLRELQPQTEIGLVNEIEPELEEEPEEVELPGWLIELAPEAEEEAETTAFGESKTGLATEAEIPDWLRELQPGIPTGAQVEPAESVGEPEFVSEIEPELEEEFEETKLPDWLTELSPLAEEEAEVTAFATAGEVEFAGEDEIPDWLRDLGPEAVEETPLEMSEPVKTLEEAELPDWLIVPQVEPVAEPPVDQATVAQAVSAIELSSPVEEMPDWLVELESEIAGTTTGLLEPVTAPEPETIRSEVLTVTEPQPSVVAAESVHVELPEPMEGMPDWLVELESEIVGMATIQPEAVIEPEGMPEERVSVLEGVEEELPAWLRELQPEAEVSVEETAELVKEVIEEEVEPVQEAEIPAWLRELQPETEVSVEETAELVKEVIEEEVEPVQEAEIPAWLRELEPEAELEEQVTLPSVEDIVIEPELSEQDIPDWLRELEPESELVVEPSEWEAISEVVPVAEEPEAEIDLIPDWLAQLEQEPSADLKTSATLMTEDVEGEPAWLVELQAQEERASEQITVDAMPDWLEQLHEAEPRTEVVSAPVEPTPGIKLEPEPESIVQQVGPEIGETPVVEVVAPALKPVSARVRGLDAQAIAKPGDFQTQRDLALAYLRDDDPDAAARVFSSLVVKSATIGDLVEDLETAVQSYPDSAALYQLLGDAYMRADRYAAALEAYKKSLANLG